jgi:Class III cytochrome C family/Cytochrome c7 and related cytochrome c
VKTGKRQTHIRLVVLAAAAVLFGAAMLRMPAEPVNAKGVRSPAPTRTPRVKAAARPARYSEFPHNAKAHRLECNTCHKFPSANCNKVRAEKAAFPDQTDYPHHESCVSCHKQQFFKGSPPAVCSICHTNPSPRDNSRHPFPNPREIFDKSPKGKTAQSDFVVGFPHDKHIEIVSRHAGEATFINASFSDGARRLAAEESCAVCHQTMSPQGSSDDEFLTEPPEKLGDGFWVRKGMFKSAPIGHTTCFTCHNADTGIVPAQQSCGTCHKLKPLFPPADYDVKIVLPMKVEDKPMLDAWARRESAGKFRHEFFAHVDLSCATCHNVLTMNTSDPATRRVSVSACATCHATATSDDGGAINYEVDQRKADPAYQCAKCHITFGKQPIPGSHLKAITDAAGK